METMKAVVFKGKDRIAVEEVPRPVVRAGEARHPNHDDHDLRHRRAHRPRRVSGQARPDARSRAGRHHRRARRRPGRVVHGRPAGHRRGDHAVRPVLLLPERHHSQCGGGLGGWRFGNTINGAWAEYLLVPDARANLASIPDHLADEDVMLCPDIFSTGLSGAESGNIRVGDAVAIFAQGPIGLCATLGAA